MTSILPKTSLKSKCIPNLTSPTARLCKSVILKAEANKKEAVMNEDKFHSQVGEVVKVMVYFSLLFSGYIFWHKLCDKEENSYEK